MAEQRRIKRKKTPIQRGESWKTSSVSSLYLDDIRFVFEVMTDYSATSPSYRRETGWFEAQSKLIQRIEERTGSKSIEASDAFPPLDAPDPPVSIEVDDYVVFSIEDLLSLNLAGADGLTMRVGLHDLSLSCHPLWIEIEVFDEAETARIAYQEIQRRISKRRNAFLERVLQKSTLTRLTFLVFALTITWVLVQHWIIGVVLSLVCLLSSVFALWYVAIWSRRDVVVLEYRKNVHDPWYSSDAFKVAFSVGALLLILGILAAALGLDVP